MCIRDRGEGARECAELLEDKSIGQVYGFHNQPGCEYKTVMIRKEGTAHYASKGIIIQFKGRATHAATPEKGLNSAVPLSELVTRVNDWNNLDSYIGDVLCTGVGINAGGRIFGMQAKMCIRDRGRAPCCKLLAAQGDVKFRIAAEAKGNADAAESAPKPDKDGFLKAITRGGFLYMNGDIIVYADEADWA